LTLYCFPETRAQQCLEYKGNRREKKMREWRLFIKSWLHMITPFPGALGLLYAALHFIKSSARGSTVAKGLGEKCKRIVPPQWIEDGVSCRAIGDRKISRQIVAVIQIVRLLMNIWQVLGYILE
jgi:hypothetical protein